MTDIRDKIMEYYYDFYAGEGKAPNILRIPEDRWDEFERVIQKSPIYRKADPLGKVKHWWYMGMRVFAEIWSFGVEWSKETAEIKGE